MTPWPSDTPGDGVAPCSPKYASSPCSLRSSPESCSRTPALAPSVAWTSARMTAVPAAAITTAARIATSCTPIWAKLPASQPSPPAGFAKIGPGERLAPAGLGAGRGVDERKNAGRAGRGDPHGGENRHELHPHLGEVAGQPAVPARRVRQLGGEHTREERPSHSREPVAGEHVQRVIEPCLRADLNGGVAHERRQSAHGQ